MSHGFGPLIASGHTAAHSFGSWSRATGWTAVFLVILPIALFALGWWYIGFKTRSMMNEMAGEAQRRLRKAGIEPPSAPGSSTPKDRGQP